ncbi:MULTISPECIES: enoyl-CoA hydratase-related protein [Metallosphaera]|uniref:enoyl-CoA hydratase-related protein n=1 Tax=Metallosphaera TaxID=41980 RepID=UPI001F06C1B4|nr:enoyl-CoA hydratase-related protein [Metallosphaera sedula]MCH1771144.1 enoyl-CoA hydratase-related protein [Metallosphaera sedula]MCP6729516.1 enoyl-CoA hydratase-related protein [Metallosphaera sedula]
MSLVQIRDHGPVSVISLSRPDKLNALSLELRSELLGSLRRFNSDPGKRVAILTGEGKAFSVGADLSSISSDLTEDLRSSFYPILREIRFSSKIYISAVNGVTAGAGISLALACDVKIASRGSRFVTAFHNIGLAPDTGLTLILARLGGTRFLDRLLLGGEIMAEELEREGILKISDDPLSEALKLGEEISTGPFRSYVASKKLINRALYHDLEEYLEYESAMQGYLGTTQDFKEGVKAFLEKRKPSFRGE